MSTVGEDRRRTFRTPVLTGVARCSTRGRARDGARPTVGLYDIRDLSIGGALLVGTPIARRTRVGLRLLLPGQGPLRVTAEVARDADDDRLAVKFGQLTANVEDCIEEALVLEYMRQHTPVTLVAHASANDGVRLAHWLQSRGHGARHALTPLDVIACLDNARIPASTVFIDENFHGEAVELTHFLVDAYPRLRRVLVLGTTVVPSWSKGLFHDQIMAPCSDAQLDRVAPRITSSPHPLQSSRSSRLAWGWAAS